MDELSIYNNPVVLGHSPKIARLVEGLSLDVLRSVFSLTIVYYVIPFMVDGYIYETRLRDFMHEVQSVRDVVESKIGEDRFEMFEKRLREATIIYDRTLKRVEKRYMGNRSLKVEEQIVTDSPAQMQIQNLNRDEVIWAAKRWIGTPYYWGGTTMWIGTDCSGFTQSVFHSFGVQLPRTAREQFNTGMYVPQSYLKEGDLVFFTTTRPGVSHVGIYAGEGRFIHASSRTGWVTVSNLNESYFAKRYVGARRILT